MERMNIIKVYECVRASDRTLFYSISLSETAGAIAFI